MKSYSLFTRVQGKIKKSMYTNKHPYKQILVKKTIEGGATENITSLQLDEIIDLWKYK